MYNNEDRSGIYTLYVKNEVGTILTRRYSYGKIFADRLVFRNAAGQEFPTLEECGGGSVTASCVIYNDTDRQISPSVVTAFYNSGRLTDVSADNAGAIAASESKPVEWTINADTSDITAVKVMFIDSMITLRPLTKCRVIYEKLN